MQTRTAGARPRWYADHDGERKKTYTSYATETVEAVLSLDDKHVYAAAFVVALLPYATHPEGWSGSVNQLCQIMGTSTGRKKRWERVNRALLQLEQIGLIWVKRDGRYLSLGIVPVEGGARPKHLGSRPTDSDQSSEQTRTERTRTERTRTNRPNQLGQIVRTDWDRLSEPTRTDCPNSGLSLDSPENPDPILKDPTTASEQSEGTELIKTSVQTSNKSKTNSTNLLNKQRSNDDDDFLRVKGPELERLVRSLDGLSHFQNVLGLAKEVGADVVEHVCKHQWGQSYSDTLKSPSGLFVTLCRTLKVHGIPVEMSPEEKALIELSDSIERYRTYRAKCITNGKLREAEEIRLHIETLLERKKELE